MLVLCKRCLNLLHHTQLLQTRMASSFTNFPHLNIFPATALVDERLHISANNLKPNQKVTLRAWLRERSAVFSSYAHFVADIQGCVNVNLQRSLGGTYTGADGMGLFWSMKPVEGVSKRTRLVKADVTTPMVFELTLLDGHVVPDRSHELPSVVLATTTCERWYKHKDVKRIPVREGSIRGTLFLPAGSGPFLGLVDMFGTSGGLVEMRGALLASRGFATLSLAYLGYEDLPTKIEDLDFNYFLEAVDWLSSQPFVQPNGIGVLGVSKGGELSFLLSMYSEKVKAAVNVSGAPCFGFGDLKKDGKLFVRGAKFDASKVVIGEDGAATFHDCFPSFEIIEAWQRDVPLLYLCGDDDGSWDTQRGTALMRDSFPPEKKKNLDFVMYPDAGHLIEPPYMPLCYSSKFFLQNMMVRWGGQPKAHAFAQEDSWKRIQHFFRQHLDNQHASLSKL